MLKGIVSGVEKDITRIPMWTSNAEHEGWEVRDNEDRLIWGREDELQTTTGTLPFKGYSLPLKVKSLLGNAVQNGTPAPDNIITPEMCGVRTENLFDVNATPTTPYQDTTVTVSGQQITITGQWYIYFEIAVTQNTDYYLSWNIDYAEISGRGTIAVMTTSGNVIHQQNTVSYTFNSGENEKIRLYIYSSSSNPATVTLSNIMLNLGSTAIPYEPYGWKIHFENHGENLLQLKDGLSKKINNVQFTINNQIITASGASTGSGGRTTKLSGDFLLPAGTYYLSLSGVTTGIAAYIQRTSDSAILGGSGNSFTVPTDVSVFIGCNVNENTVYDGSFGVMLTPGSEAKPYSPYLNETIPVYLGEVPTVRRVRKFVLTGEERFIDEGLANGFYRYRVYLEQLCDADTNDVLSSHYPAAKENKPNFEAIAKPLTVTQFCRFYSLIPSLNDFKSYLASEYAAGHPVTIWYVLDNEEITIANEPLAKIGDYADELNDIVATLPEIPTTSGQNTLTVDTDLAPSKLEVSVHAKKIHYGFKIDKSNDDSDSAVIYTHDAVTMTPAHMDFINDRFDYGSWGNAFFVRDCYPVALNLDGTEAYRLDPDDYTKKLDGTPSDIFYELLTEEPSDWSTQWKQYYTKSGDEYVLNSQSEAPTFATDTYYKLTYSSSHETFS